MIQALADYYEGYNSNVHRGVHSLSMEATDRYEEARAKVASFIGAAEPESIVWTRNTTEGINLVAHTWARQNVRPGDEIVVSQIEHHSNLVPWQQVAAEQGAELRFLPMANDGSMDMGEVDSIITPRTRLLAVVHSSNSLGTIHPVKDLAAMARSVGAAVLVDGAQTRPAHAGRRRRPRLRLPGLLGAQDDGPNRHRRAVREARRPRGDGALPNRAARWCWRSPTNELPGTPSRCDFEAGTPNIADAVALGAAVDYLDALGMDNVRTHEVELTRYALERFRELEEIDVFGPADLDRRGGVVSFNSADVHPHDLGTVLDRQGIAIRPGHHCTMPVMRKLGLAATARASFYVYNTEDEVDLLVDGIKRALRYFGDGVGRTG